MVKGVVFDDELESPWGYRELDLDLVLVDLVGFPKGHSRSGLTTVESR